MRIVSGADYERPGRDTPEAPTPVEKNVWSATA
jgi:hypothetical protein